MVMVCEERYELAISMPCVISWRRYPCVVAWLCVDMEGKGRDVGDCTNIVVRHNGAQWSSPFMSERRRGGADEVPGRCGGTLRVGEVYDAGYGM